MQKPNHILHLLLTVITGGLWIPVWIYLSFKKPREKVEGTPFIVWVLLFVILIVTIRVLTL